MAQSPKRLRVSHCQEKPLSPDPRGSEVTKKLHEPENGDDYYDALEAMINEALASPISNDNN